MIARLYTQFIYLITIFTLYGCAQKAQPTGGKKDNIAPKLLVSTPKDQTKNFKGNIVQLSFDEYVKTDNINSNLLITPAIKGSYKTKMEAMGAKLTFDQDAFLPNTTYSLNFRSTFKDITESNEAKNIKIVFSTGPQIDSLKVAGQIIDLLSNKPIFNALVGLYKYTDTLNIKKEKPYYFSKTDSTGNYNIENIAPGTYKLFAFDDANNNTVFNENIEKIGYQSDKIELNKNLEKQNFTLVRQNKLLLKILRTQTSVRYGTIELNKGVKSLTIKYLNDSILPYMLTDKTLKIFNTTNQTDTLKFEITARDSVDRDTTIIHKLLFKKPTKKTDGAKEEFRFKTTPTSNVALEQKTEFKIDFNKPIGSYDYTKIKILADTLKEIAIADSHFIWNAYKTSLTIKADAKPKTTYRLKFLPLAFLSIENDSSKIFQQDNPILIPDETGIIAGTITAAKGYEIVQLLNQTLEVVKEIKYQKKYEFKLVPPGKYYLRILHDANKNGLWDAGDYQNNIQPEIIQYNKDLIQLKANFELNGYNF